MPKATREDLIREVENTMDEILERLAETDNRIRRLNEDRAEAMRHLAKAHAKLTALVTPAECADYKP